MLRITKSTPGILDLSAVKDEFGLPVMLNGSSHRDVPDFEGDNPILQRVIEARWVTLSKVPIEATDEPALEPADTPLSDPMTTAQSELAAGAEPAPSNTSLPGPVTDTESELATVTEPAFTDSNLNTRNDDQTTTSVADIAPSQTVKPERKSRRT